MNCSLHPEEPVTGSCDRCGNFVCRLDARSLSGRTFCSPCSGRADVDHLEALKRDHWGRRDVFAWLNGCGAVVNGLALIFWLVATTYAVVVVGIRSSGYVVSMGSMILYTSALVTVDGAYFLRRKWSRIPAACMPMLQVPFVVNTWIARPPTDEDTQARHLALLVSGVVLPLGIGVASLASTRNSMFFEIEVSRAALQRLWDKTRNNPSARLGFIVSFLGLASPGISVVALGLSLHGLWCVDPNARPPIERRWQAVVGIALSLVGLVLWGVIAASIL